MPRYDYRCRACQQGFMIERGINEEAGEIRCPQCRSAEVARDYSGVAFGGKAMSVGKNCSGGCSSCGSSCSH